MELSSICFVVIYSMKFTETWNLELAKLEIASPIQLWRFVHYKKTTAQLANVPIDNKMLSYRRETALQGAL